MNDNSSKSIRLLILGVHEYSEAYPNSFYRIMDLDSDHRLTIKKIHSQGWFRNTSIRKSFSKKIINTCLFFRANLIVFFKSIFFKRYNIVYVTYPSILLAILLGLLTKKKIVIDAFISAYDTAVKDRALVNEKKLTSRILFHIERLSFVLADAIIVDSDANSIYLANIFKLPKNKFYSVPLSTNELEFRPTEYSQKTAISRVLFIGTLVPLHGIETICGAIRTLKANKLIHFKIIGDGQENHFIDNLSRLGLKNFTWIRKWQNSSVLFEEISNADICLGIFGNTPKAARVIPYKLYAYARIGRPIISSGLNPKPINEGKIPWIHIEPGNSDALAAAILYLHEDISIRTRISENSKKYYNAYLSNRKAKDALISIFEDLKNQ